MKKIMVYGLLLFTFLSSKAMFLNRDTRYLSTLEFKKHETKLSKEHSIYSTQYADVIKVALVAGCFTGVVVLGGIVYGNGGLLPPVSYCAEPVVGGIGIGIAMGVTVYCGHQKLEQLRSRPKNNQSQYE